MSEKALADTDYSDLIAVDKMRLLNKMILQPLYQQNNLQSDEQQNNYKRSKTAQKDYHEMVDKIIDQVKNAPLDDRQHTLEDITSLMISSIKTAANEFGSQEDEYENEE